MISTSFFYKRFGLEFKDNVIDNGISLDTTQWINRKDTDKIYWPAKKDSLSLAEARVEMKRSQKAMNELRIGFDDVFKNLKYITFLLLPIYAVIFLVLYFRSGRFYVEHVVFTMHFQVFMYCLFSVTLTLPFILPIGIDAIRHISVWVLMIYLWISLHVLYKERWWVTSIKTFVAATFMIFTTQLSLIFFAFFFR